MKTKRRLLSWILAVCMIFQAMPSVASAAELVDGSLSFDLSISVAEGTQAPENYCVEYNVVNADGADVNGSGYAGIVSGSDGTQTISLTGLQDDYQIKIKVINADLGIRLSGADVTEEGWTTGKIITISDLQDSYNFELFEKAGGGNSDAPINIQVRNSQNGNTQYKISDEENWTDINQDQKWPVNNAKDGDVVYIRAIPNDGQELDTAGTSYYRDGEQVTLSEEDFSALKSETGYSFSYKEGSNYEFTVEYRNNGGNPPEIDDPYEISVSVDETSQTYLEGPVYVDNIQVNDDGTVTVNKAETHTIKFTVTFPYELESITINEKEETLLTFGDGWYGAEVAEAASYHISFTIKGVSGYTIIWADPGAKPQEGTYDESDILTHGKARAIAVYDENDKLIEDAIPKNTDGGVDEGGYGWLFVQAGYKIVFEFVPEYGYQLTSVKTNDTPLEPQDAVNQYTFTMPETNIHFSAEFTPKEDVVNAKADAVSSGEIELPDGALNAGSAQLSVENVELPPEKIAEFNKQAEKEGGYEVATFLDINLHQVFYKGSVNSEDVWSNQINELNNKATITLKLKEGQDGNQIVIVHDVHNDGNFEIIPVVFDPETNTITFETSSFSNYAIATKPIPETNAFMVDFDPMEGSEKPGQVLVSVDGKQITANSWEYYEYADGSKPITFTLVPPADREAFTPYVELEFPDECLIYEAVKVGKKNNAFTYSVTPNKAAKTKNPNFILHVFWSEFDECRPDYDEFVIHTNVINESKTEGLGGTIEYDKTPIRTKSLGNETKQIFSIKDFVTVTIAPEETTVVSFISIGEDVFVTNPDPENNREHALSLLEKDGKYVVDCSGDNEYNYTYLEVRFAEHPHVGIPVPAKEPTCTEVGCIEHYVCNICGREFKDEKCTVEITGSATIEMLPHTPSKEWFYDETNHFHCCTVCKTPLKEDAGNHTYNSDNICTVCGAEKPVSEPAFLWCEPIADYTYTGKAITPDPEVYCEDTRLVKGKDYTVSYKNNINAGTATVTIKGKGNYTGTATQNFTIHRANIEDVAWASDIYLSYNKKVQTPAIVVKKYSDDKPLRKGADYDLFWNGEIKEPGEYLIKVAGIKNYTGETYAYVYVTEKKLVSKLKISKIPNQPYTGAEITPSITVKDGKEVLTEGVDYGVAYDVNVEVGKAYAFIYAMDTETCRYEGYKELTFQITGTPISKAKVTGLDTLTYTGEALTLPNLTLMVGDKKLTEDTDYTITYSKNVNAGTATVMITGKGGYTGSVKKTFKIKPYDVKQEGSKVIVQVSDAVYTKGGAKAEVLVKMLVDEDTSYSLVAGKDYTVAYKYNTKLASKDDGKYAPTATITFKGNYTGKLVENFSVTPADLSVLDMKADDKIYSTKKAAWKQTAVKIYDTDGKLLKAGTDYEKTLVYSWDPEGKYVIADTDIPEIGTFIYVTATGKGNYAGTTLVGEYHIVRAMIGSAKITVDKQYYNGNALEPRPATITITIGKVKTPLIEGIDFEIVGYKNNVNKGTATMIIRGIGEYGGTKEVKFSIISSPVVVHDGIIAL